MLDPRSATESGENGDEKYAILTMHRRRYFQRQACVISVMAAFVIGLSLGVFVPVIGLDTAISNKLNDIQLFDINHNSKNNHMDGLRFPTIYDIQGDKKKFHESYAITFLSEKKGPTVSNKNDLVSSVNFDRIFDSRYSARAKTRKITLNRSADGKNVHINKPYQSQQHQYHQQKQQQLKIQRLQHLSFFTKSLERSNKNDNKKWKRMPNDINGLSNDKLLKSIDAQSDNRNYNLYDVIVDDIFWGKIVENAIPIGYTTQHANNWNNYVNENRIVKLEIGCGRMQNRLITFQNGRKACARYRQNTDQIQGELFSFYLGRLLNLTNLAPSAPSVIDLNSNPWLSVAQDIQTAQWKSQRPVVLTDWIENLESANIPVLFQSKERHLNIYDVENIALGSDFKPTKTLLETLSSGNGIQSNLSRNQFPMINHSTDMKMINAIKQKLIELAQWSDLIIFDYLIANLDRVVNNLYNFQWNAEIMTAPAHNLARQRDSQLLVFLDNESGLLHGYRLLKKYETYHGLLLDNLCVFRRPTIVALQQLKNDGIGKRLQQLFEQSTTDKVRDILPSLPDKSIKILMDRIDRVLGQVQKCRKLFQSR